MLLILLVLLLLFYVGWKKWKTSFTYHHQRILSKDHQRILHSYLKREYQTASNYLDDPEVTHFYILDRNHILVSYFHIVPMENHRHYIHYLYTHPSYRKQGHAKQLLRYGLSRCGLNSIHSWTSVNNQASIQTFTSLGFTSSIEKDRVIFEKQLFKK
jgi:ribosomal protein S18 acetylase RimI-like enzyme